MTEVAAPPQPRRREAIKTPEASKGNPYLETARVTSAWVNRKINAARERVAKLSGDERRTFLEQNPTEAALITIDTLTNLPEDGSAYLTNGPDGKVQSFYPINNEAGKPIATISLPTLGDGWQVEKIFKGDGENFYCEVRNATTTRTEGVPPQNPIVISRDALISAMVVSEQSNILAAFGADEQAAATVVANYISALGKGAGAEQFIADMAKNDASFNTTLVEAADKANFLTKTDLEICLNNMNPDEKPPDGAEQKVIDEVNARNLAKKAERDKILNTVTGNLLDYDEILTALGKDFDYRAAAKEAKATIDQLEQNLTLRVGEEYGPVPRPGETRPRVTEPQRKKWETQLRMERVAVELLTKVENGEENVLGSFFRRGERGELSPKQAARARAAFRSGNLDIIAEGVMDNFMEVNEVEKKARTQQEQEERDRSKAAALEGVKRFAKFGGSLFVMLMLMELLQGAKGGGGH